MTRFTIPPEHPCLAGHFPGQPIVPGVVLLDEIAAALGVTPAGFTSVRFNRPVRPGDVVDVAGEGARFTAQVDGAVVVQGTFAPR